MSGMTVEHKIVVGLQDIKRISYECKKCGARNSFPLGNTRGPISNCYICGEKWLAVPSPSPYASQPSAYTDFLKAVADINTLETQGTVGFRMVFEFDEP